MFEQASFALQYLLCHSDPDSTSGEESHIIDGILRKLRMMKGTKVNLISKKITG